MMQRIKTHHGRVTALAFTQDGRHLVSGGSDGQVRIWSLGALAIARSIAAHDGAVTSLALGVHGETVITAGADRTLKCWTTADGALQLAIDAHERAAVRVIRSPTDEIIASVDEGGCIRIWHAQSGRRLCEMQSAAGPAQLGFLPSGAMAMAASHGRILIRDPGTAETRHETLAPDGRIDALAASPTHEALLVGAGPMLRLIDPRGIETYREWRLEAPPAALVFSADGELALAALPDGLAGLDVRSGARRFSIALPKSQTSPIALSPAGECLAVGLARGEIGLWPAERLSARQGPGLAG